MVLSTDHRHVWGLQNAHIGLGQSARAPENKGENSYVLSQIRDLYSVDTMPAAGQI